VARRTLRPGSSRAISSRRRIGQAEVGQLRRRVRGLVLPGGRACWLDGAGDAADVAANARHQNAVFADAVDGARLVAAFRPFVARDRGAYRGAPKCMSRMAVSYWYLPAMWSRVMLTLSSDWPSSMRRLSVLRTAGMSV
jgi:hypothetical protein